MRDFGGKVAVVTGAASGIGRALAEHSAREGMKVVLADISEADLASAARALTASGASVQAVRTDVSKPAEVEALARRTVEVFGAVHLLFSNAGVGIARKPAWETTAGDWQWVFGVNFWGVVHCVRAFVPLMLSQGNECHIVNTASLAGLTSGPGLGAYQASKFAVVALSETLYHDLAARSARVKVSVLCPGGVDTRLNEAERSRPVELLNPGTPPGVWQARPRPARADVMPPAEVADRVFGAIREERFYILTHSGRNVEIKERVESLLAGRSPARRP